MNNIIKKIFFFGFFLLQKNTTLSAQQLLSLEAIKNLKVFATFNIGQNSENIRSIYVMENDSTFLSTTIYTLPNINQLKFIGIDLKRFEQIKFNQFIYLQSVIVEHGTFKLIPTNLQHIKHLTYLDLSENYIDSLPKFVLEFPNLQVLNISNQFTNGLRLPKNVECFQLRQLILSGNKIQDIQSFFKNLPFLEELNLDNCGLDSLPDEIGNLKNLKLLNISNNNITVLPETLRLLKNINYIDLSNTKIKRLPTWLIELKTLSKIKLSNTSMEYTIEEKIRITEELEEKIPNIWVEW